MESPFNGIISVELFFDVRNFDSKDSFGLRESVENVLVEELGLEGFVSFPFHESHKSDLSDSREAGKPLVRLRDTRGFSGWDPRSL